MKEYSKSFYKSRQWQECRNAFMSSKHGLCERCLSKGKIVPAEIVHHKVEITKENISDPNVTLSWNNLEALCRECHAEAHGARQRRYTVDDMGRVTIK